MVYRPTYGVHLFALVNPKCFPAININKSTDIRNKSKYGYVWCNYTSDAMALSDLPVFSGIYSRRKFVMFLSPMKHTPVLSFFVSTRSPCSFLSANCLTWDFSSDPNGNKHCRRCDSCVDVTLVHQTHKYHSLGISKQSFSTISETSQIYVCQRRYPHMLVIWGLQKWHTVTEM